MSHHNNNNGQRSLISIALETRPQSTYSRIVFPWDQLSKQFTKHEFNPVQTQDRISEDDIDRVLNSLKKSKDYLPNQSKWLTCGICSFMILFFLYIFAVVAIFGRRNSKDDDNEGRRRDRHNEEEDGEVAVTVFIMLGVVGFLVATCCITSIAEKKYKAAMKRRMDDFNNIFKDFNQNEFKAKDVEWKVGNYGAWVTLELNYKLRQNMMMNGLNMANTGNVGSGLPILNAHVNKGAFIPQMRTAKM